MSSATFDSLTYSKRLQELGFPREQAEGFAQLQREILDDRLVTKDHLDMRLRELETRQNIRLAELKNDLPRWIMGIAVAQTALIVALLALLK